MKKIWITKVMEKLGVSRSDINKVPNIKEHISERKVGPNTGYMITVKGAEMVEEFIKKTNRPVEVTVKLRPRNSGVLICTADGKDYTVKVRHNFNFSVGQKIEVTPDGDFYQLSKEWAVWERRKT